MHRRGKALRIDSFGKPQKGLVYNLKKEIEVPKVEQATFDDLTTGDQVKINTAISTAIAILNMSDDETIKDMAANIADTLISITNPSNL